MSEPIIYDFFCDIDQLEMLNTTYRNKIETLMEIYTSICSEMDKFSDDWKGASYDSFCEKYEVWKKEYLNAIMAAIAFDTCLSEMASLASGLLEQRDSLGTLINKL